MNNIILFFKNKRRVYLGFFFVFFLFLLSMPSICSEEFGYGNTDSLPTNYSTINVNHSLTSDYATSAGSADTWDGLDTPADILHSDLDNLEWSVAGHIIDANIDMNNHLLEDFSTLVLSGGGYIGDFSGILFSASDFNPVTTLFYDLGSGANRWDWLYVRNISAEVIDAFDGTFSGNLTISGSLNGINISNLSNEFTYYSDEDWINKNDSNSFNFNGTKLSTTYYNATQSTAVAGTIDDGELGNTQHPDGHYDGMAFNFTEVAGSPGLDFRINFTDVDSFNSGVMRYKTSALSGDYPIIQLWNYDFEAWEDYPSVSETETFAVITQPVYDYESHLSGGLIQMRLYKLANGNINNHYYLDWIAISKGYGTPSGYEIDPIFTAWLNNPIFEHNVNATMNVIVQGNLTSDNIIGNNGTFSGNLIVDGSINGLNLSNFTNEYLEIDGSNANQNISISPYALHMSDAYVNYIRHEGDTDTYLAFDEDRWIWTTGGVVTMDSQIDGSSYFTFGSFIADIDVNILGNGKTPFHYDWGDDVIHMSSDTYVNGTFNFAHSDNSYGDFIDGPIIRLYNYHGTDGSFLNIFKSAGSYAAPSYNTDGQIMFGFGARPIKNTGTKAFSQRVGFEVYADGTHSQDNTPSSVGIKVVPTGGVNAYVTTMFRADGDVEFTGDINLTNDNQKLSFGATQTDLEIFSDGNNPIYNSTGVHTFYNLTGLGVIRVGSITYSTPENKDYKALDELIDPALLTSRDKPDDVFHSTFPEPLQQIIQVTDPDNCQQVIDKYCWIEDELGDGEITICREKLPLGIKDYTITYRRECGTKDELVISAGDWAMFNYKAIYELKQENDLLKSELCLRDPTYSWC